MKPYIIIITFVLIPACCIIISAFVIHSARASMRNQYDALLQKLDRAVGGRKLETYYDESLDAAIAVRLNRIVEISKMQKDQAVEERDIIKSLISDISHQIRTPLSNITLYTGLLKEQVSDDKSLAYARKIEKNAEKLEFFMKELIRTSYTEQEIISVCPRKADVDTMIKRACQLAELSALKKNVRLIADDNGYQCFADSKWTEEALANVIENAVKYSPAGSSVRISSAAFDSFICIRVRDQGIGIPEEEQGKVFQRFYRGTNANTEQGFGIGLYLAREIISRQNGYIKLESKLNEGTAIHIFLSRIQIQ